MNKKLKWWHLLVGTVSLILISVLALHLFFRWSLANYKAELASKGEVLDAAPFNARGCPDNESTEQVWSAFDHLPKIPDSYPSAMRSVLPGKSRVAWKGTTYSEEEIQEWKNLEKFVTDTKGEDFHKLLTGLEQGCLSVKYSWDFNVASSRLASFKRIAQVMQMTTLWNLHNTNVTAAVRSAKGLLDAVNAATTEPVMIVELVRVACASIGVGSSWELLQTESVQDADLIALQRAWERQDWRSNLAATHRGERALIVPQFKNIKNREQFTKTIFWDHQGGVTEALAEAGDTLFTSPRESFGHLSKAAILGNAYPYWIMFGQYREVEALLRNSAGRIAAAEKLKNNEPVTRTYAKDNFRTPLLSAQWGESNSMLAKYLERLARAETQRDMVVAAIALYRYKKAKGQYPDRLEELMPLYLTKLPVDWFVAKPMQYRKQNDDTYLLYSVGVNLKDEGGKPGEKGGLFTQTGDMVWPWPTTEEEIKRANQEMRK